MSVLHIACVEYQDIRIDNNRIIEEVLIHNITTSNKFNQINFFSYLYY